MADLGMGAANRWYYSNRDTTAEKTASGSFESGLSQQIIATLHANPFSATRRLLVMMFAGYLRVPGGPLRVGGPEKSEEFAPIPDLHLASFGPGGSIALSAPDTQWLSLEGTLAILVGTGGGGRDLWVGLEGTPWLALHTRMAEVGPWSLQMVGAAGLGFAWLQRDHRSTQDAGGNVQFPSETVFWFRPSLRLGLLFGP